MKENVRTTANAMKGLNDITLKGEIAVFGATYMSKFPLYEFINKYHFENAIYNRSIEGLTTSEALEIVQDCIISISPSKIFIALGEEDENNMAKQLIVLDSERSGCTDYYVDSY